MGCKGGAVADPSLNVYDFEALKVAGLSIPSLNVAANAMKTAIVIAEKVQISLSGK